MAESVLTCAGAGGRFCVELGPHKPAEGLSYSPSAALCSPSLTGGHLPSPVRAVQVFLQARFKLSFCLFGLVLQPIGSLTQLRSCWTLDAAQRGQS